MGSALSIDYKVNATKSIIDYFSNMETKNLPWNCTKVSKGPPTNALNETKGLASLRMATLFTNSTTIFPTSLNE